MKAGKVCSALAFLALFAVIVFFTFRGSTNVSDLSWMPQRWGLWLDEHDEFRHFIGFSAFAAVCFMLNFDSVFNRSRSRFVRKFRSSRCLFSPPCRPGSCQDTSCCNTRRRHNSPIGIALTKYTP